MSPMNFLVRVSAILLFTFYLQADDAPLADPDLPQPLDFSFADELVTHSPFTRAVNLQESLQLTGIAYVDGHPMATVLNKETKQRYVVSEDANAQGWRLVTASPGAELYQTYIEMQVGEEIVAMHYQGQQLSPGGNGKAELAVTNKKNGDKVKPSSFLSEQDRDLYGTLSPEARDKFKDIMKSRLEKHPELTPDQTSDYAQKVFAKLNAADSSSTSGSVKTPKPSKKRQGA